ncbi:glycerophosphodiester phosphodiesterase [Enterococcus villorum]|uniref:glycerophosphodiester phosphodiesterase n=1 Tax=Enterococcus villorum TaxID=112904 RepID=UPI003F8CB007
MVQIFAHRGSSGTHPENTLPAFAEAVRQGVDGIELDVHLSKDEQIIVIHDEEVDRTTNGHGLVREKTLAQLKKLNAGSWFNSDFHATKVPTLKEVVHLLSEMNYRGTLMIEIKTDKYDYVGIEEKVVNLLKESDWPFHHAYCSFNIQSLERLAKIEPTAQLDLLLSTSHKKVLLAENTPSIEGIHPRVDWYFEHVTSLESFPKAIRCWTVNEEDQMRQCFNQQMTAFITDFPEKALRIKQTMKK